MKKILSLVIIMMTLCIPIHAQNYEEINIVTINGSVERCAYQYDSIRINQDVTCQTEAFWIVCNSSGTNTFFEGDANHIIITPEMEHCFYIYYSDCNSSKEFEFHFIDFEDVPEPWTEDTKWLARGETLELDAYYSENLSYLWQDNSTDWRYFVTGPETSGNIWCLMYNDCGAESDTINVYYNPEPSTVSVDPNTGHIIVTWVVDPTMATYLEYVDIYRDGFSTPIARVPYSAGQYIDEAVDGNVTSRYYAFKGIAYDGSECGWYSDAKPSIHADYTLAVNDDIVILFNNVASQYEDLYIYYIAEWDGYNATHIDSVGIRKDGTLAFNSHKRFTINRDGTIQYRAPSYYFNPDSYLIVDAGFLQGEKRDDNRELRSNKSEGTVSVKASFEVKCSLFPNPATHQFTVMGLETGTLTLYNQLGQVILTQEISGETIIGVNGLPSGVYFAKISTPLGVCTEQVVVE